MAEEVDPASQTDDGDGTHTIAYGAADIKSLKSLELSCERDEAQLFADIEKVELAELEEDGTKATAITYKEVDDFDMAHLTFVSFSNEVDGKKIKATHKAKGEEFLFDGECFVNEQVVKVLVFREKPK